MSVDLFEYYEGSKGPPYFDGEELEDDLSTPCSYLHGSCPYCPFKEDEIFWEGDEEDKEAARERLKKNHQSASPDCPGQLEFGVF